MPALCLKTYKHPIKNVCKFSRTDCDLYEDTIFLNAKQSKVKLSLS